MAKISGRHAVLLFAGGTDVLMGMVFILIGVDSALRFSHGAVGIPMWAGILLIVVGLGNILAVLTAKGKKRNSGSFNINLGALLLNLFGMILAACVIGFYTWGAWPALEIGLTDSGDSEVFTNDDLISIYATVIFMASFVLILSLIALFMDCCVFALSGNSGPRNFYGPAHPHMYDGPHGLPPASIYKQ